LADSFLRSATRGFTDNRQQPTTEELSHFSLFFIERMDPEFVYLTMVGGAQNQAAHTQSRDDECRQWRGQYFWLC
jgi:hypothetical protein